jgi:thymidylate synthase (FAD)
MEQLPSEKIPCLDRGHVQLLDVMGDDQAIVDAARTSIAGKSVKASSSTKGLIRYLLRHRHTTPFEMVEFKFEMKMPIFVARQFIRHRTANVNEMSGRYSEMPEEFYVPDPENVKVQASKNKQGRGEEVLENAEDICRALHNEAQQAFSNYHGYLEEGMARELARSNLPLSTYTQWVWKCDLHNIMHLLSLRLHPHAQWEIRVFAEAMAELIKPYVPIAWKAFEDYRLHGMFLTRPDIETLQLLLEDLMGNGSFTPPNNDLFPTDREYTEFIGKLVRLGIDLEE